VNLRQFSFECKGLSPLLMHWDNIEWADAISLRRSAIKADAKKDFSAGDDRCPPDTWKGCTYTDKRNIVLPTDNLRSCLMRAGAQIELKGKKTYKDLTQAAILFDDEFATFLVAGKEIDWKKCEAIAGTFAQQCEGARALGFRLFVKRAAIGQTKHIRVRPRFDEWAMKGTFTVLDDQVTDEVLEKLWSIAGLYRGIGDWRPSARQSPGPFGRFSTKLSRVGALT